MAIGEGYSTDKELLSLAKKEKNKRNDLFKYARKEYGVKVNPSDVKKYIKKQMAIIEQDEKAMHFFEKLSSALGMTLDEYIYEWEYDNFAQQLVGEEVFPIIAKNNPLIDGEDPTSYNERLFEIFNSGLNKFMEQK